MQSTLIPPPRPKPPPTVNIPHVLPRSPQPSLIPPPPLTATCCCQCPSSTAGTTTSVARDRYTRSATDETPEPHLLLRPGRVRRSACFRASWSNSSLSSSARSTQVWAAAALPRPPAGPDLPPPRPWPPPLPPPLPPEGPTGVRKRCPPSASSSTSLSSDEDGRTAALPLPRPPPLPLPLPLPLPRESPGRGRFRFRLEASCSASVWNSKSRKAASYPGWRL